MVFIKEVVNIVTVEQQISSLSPTSLKVLIGLYRKSIDGKTVEISIKNLGLEVSLTKGSIKRHLKNLEDIGFIACEERKDELNRSLANKYIFQLQIAVFAKALFSK